jgi:hypothetical protein
MFQSSPFVTAISTYGLFLIAAIRQGGPTVCALAESKNENPSKIEKRIEAFFAELYSKPLAVPHANRPATLTSGRARSMYRHSLVIPSV